MNSSNTEKFEDGQPKVIQARWGRNFDRITTPFEEFVKKGTTGGLILMATAILVAK